MHLMRRYRIAMVLKSCDHTHVMGHQKVYIRFYAQKYSRRMINVQWALTKRGKRNE